MHSYPEIRLTSAYESWGKHYINHPPTALSTFDKQQYKRISIGTAAGRRAWGNLTGVWRWYVQRERKDIAPWSWEMLQTFAWCWCPAIQTLVFSEICNKSLQTWQPYWFLGFLSSCIDSTLLTSSSKELKKRERVFLGTSLQVNRNE